MKSLKKLLCLALALIMMLSVFNISVFADDTATQETGTENVLHFDANTSGWENYKKVFCHVWIYGGEPFYAWQSKREACTDTDGDGVWTYDLDAKGIALEEGALYCLIFSNENGSQTYNLLFDTTVLGDTAYCDNDVIYESPVDSSKTAQAAFWRGQDETVFGPEKCITSIGNVVGTCIPSTVSTQDIFEDFLLNTLENARVYSGKDDQSIIDDIAKEFSLTNADVKAAIENTGVIVDWKDESAIPDRPNTDPLPEYPITSGNVIHFDANTTGWINYKRVFCHIWEYGGTNFHSWGSKAEFCTDDDGDGIWTYDLDDKGVTLKDGVLYAIIFANENSLMTYDLLFDSTVLGDTAYCEDPEFKYEAPSDSNKSYVAAFWANQDETVYGPVKEITTMGNVVGTAIPHTTSAQEMFEYFLINNLDNARTYSGEDDQSIIDDIAKELPLTKEDVKAAIENTGVEVDWSESGSETDDRLLGDVDADGVISVIDATAIQRHIAKIQLLTDDEMLVADLDADNEISVIDATAIQRIIAKID